VGVIAEEAVRIKADTSGFHSSVTSGVMSSIGKVAAAAGAALGGIAIGKALFVDPIKSAGDFEQTLNVLGATSNASKKEMSDLQANAMKLGADLKLPGTSANDAAKAMLELAKGNFTAKEAITASRGVLLLSTAAQIDNATAATYVADGLHQFGMKASESTKIVDVFAGAAVNSTADMNDVALAISQSGQAFHQLHIPVQDAGTAIAEMANAGIKGSDAGTSLKTMLQRLNPQTKQAKAAMKEMGVETFDNHGKFVGLRSVIEQMGPKLAGMTDKQRTQTLATIFGSDATRAASVILGQSTESWDKMRDKVTKAGQAQKLADAQMKGFNGAMEAVRNAVEAAQLQIGLKLIPVLTIMAQWFAQNLPTAVAAAGKAFSAIGDLISQNMDTIKAVVQGAISAVQAFASFISDNVGNVKQLAVALGIGAAAFVILTGAVRAYMIVQAALDALMAANPIGLVVIAIAALVVAFTLLYQRNESFRQAVLIAWSAIKAAADATFGYITNTIIPAAIAAWNRFGPGVVAALNSAVSAIKTVVTAIATVISTTIEAIRQNWDTIWKLLGPTVTAVMQVVKTAVQTELNVIAGVVRLFAALLRGDWSGGIVSIVGSVLRGLAATAKNLATLIGQAIGNGIKAGVLALAGLAGTITGKVGAAIAEAVGWAYTSALHIGSSIARGIVDGVGDLAGQLKDKVTGGIGSALGGIGGFIRKGSPSGLFRDEIGVPIGQGVNIGAEAALAELGPRINARIHAAAQEGVNATKANAGAIAEGFKNWATNAKAAFDKEMDGLDAKLKAQLDKAKAQIDKWKASLTPAELLLKTEAAQKEMANLQGALDKAWNALKALPQKQAQAMTELLAAQKKVMDGLAATAISTRDDALLAGNAFQKNAANNDPGAAALIQAQKTFDATKAAFDAGTATQEAFIASADALNQQKVLNADNSNATELLNQYNTWQSALAQQTAAGAAITAQQGADLTAQQQLQAQQAAETITATQAKDDALDALQTKILQQAAEKERAARDKEAEELNKHLVKRFDRINEHLDNVRKTTDAHFNELARHADDGGANLIKAISQGILSAKPTLEAALTSVANTIKQYLKVQSPTEKGPMSDLHTWWRRLGPTLVDSFDGSSVKAHLTHAVTPSISGARRAQGGWEHREHMGRRYDRTEYWLQRIHKEVKGGSGGGSATPKPLEVHIVGGIGIDASVYRSRR
jgi:TP901 family phage tail tape measure protein